MSFRQRGRRKGDCDHKCCTHYLTRSAHDTQEGSTQNGHTAWKLQKYLEFDSIQKRYTQSRNLHFYTVSTKGVDPFVLFS